MRSDITHGDRALERGGEAAAGDLTDLATLLVEDKRALPDRLTPLDLKTDTLLDRAVVELGKDSHVAGKAALGSAPLVDREGQAGHHRRRLEIEIVAVERQARLEPQRIARTEPDRPGEIVTRDRVGQLHPGVGGHGYFESVLASVPRAADPQFAPLPVKWARLHEAQLAHAGDDRFQNVGRTRALERQQRLLLHVIDDHVARQ